MTDADDLSSIQREMVRLLTSPGEIAGDPRATRLAQAWILGSSRLSPVEQLEIYREQFWLRHVGSLREDFPGLTRVLGVESWERLSAAYLSEPGNLTRALRDLGAGLPGYVAAQEWLPRRDLCRDLAALEWAYVDVFDEADDPPLDPEKVGAIPQEAWLGARIRLSSSLRLLELTHPAPDYRRSLRQLPAEAQLPPIERRQSYWVIYRRDRSLWDKEVSEAAFRLLEQLSQNTPLVPAAERVVRDLPEAAARLEEELFTWFALWGRLGWVVDVVV